MLLKLTTFPPGMEAASLDITKAYHNSPIAPIHKKYLCISWKGGIYVQHIAIEGIAIAGSIQGGVADAMVPLLKFHGINPCIKWVDDFIFFRSPINCLQAASCPPSFNFYLATILKITEPLGILWHPLSKKGHKFQSSFNYVGFKWNINSKTV